MTTYLVTGGSHGLGIPTVAALTAPGNEVRVLSRRSGPFRGDLTTGDGVDAALAGASTLVHLATTGRKDVPATRLLLDKARRAEVRHVVYISIVGVDRIDFAYYRDKFACERLVEESGMAYTILRATQFHSLIARILTAPLPVRPTLPISAQPIARTEVARRLCELAEGEPAGRVADIGGPEILTMQDMARQWNAAHRSRKPAVTLPLVGRAIGGFKAGHHMPGLPGFGTQTFTQFAAADAAGR